MALGNIEWVKSGKRERKNKAVGKRGKMWGCLKAREKSSNGKFAKVELLVGSGEQCARANINQSLKTETEGYLNTVQLNTMKIN